MFTIFSVKFGSISFPFCFIRTFGLVQVAASVLLVNSRWAIEAGRCAKRYKQPYKIFADKNPANAKPAILMIVAIGKRVIVFRF